MKVVCTHCGLTFSVARAEPAKPVFCCSGCALAFRLAAPRADASVPAPGFVAALGVVFLFFNQALNALLAALSAGNSGFAVASLAAGVLAWLALVVAQRQSGAWRISDRVAGFIALAGLVWSASAGRPGLALLWNGALLAWALRGLVRKKFRGKS